MKYTIETQIDGHFVTTDYDEADAVLKELSERDRFIVAGAIKEQTTVICTHQGDELWRVARGTKQVIADDVAYYINERAL